MNCRHTPARAEEEKSTQSKQIVETATLGESIRLNYIMIKLLSCRFSLSLFCGF